MNSKDRPKSPNDKKEGKEVKKKKGQKER